MKKSNSLESSERRSYSEYAREFRRALLSHKGNGNSHDKAKQFLKTVFQEMDTDFNGDISTIELKAFIHSVLSDYEMSSEFSDNAEKFADVLVSQIDINHDGSVSYHEMHEFLWPKVESDREVGVILDLMRENFENCIQDKIVRRALKESSDTNDRTLIDAFAKHIHMGVLRGNLIEVRALKQAFHKLNGLGVGKLSDYEVDILIESLDTNGDGVVSPREFRAWMFIPSTRMTGDSPSSTAPTITATPAPITPIENLSSTGSCESVAQGSPSAASLAAQQVPKAASSAPISESTTPAITVPQLGMDSASSSSARVQESTPSPSVAPVAAESTPPNPPASVSSSAPAAPPVPKSSSKSREVEVSGGSEIFYQAGGEGSGQTRRRVVATSSGTTDSSHRGKQSPEGSNSSKQRAYMDVQSDFSSSGGSNGYDCGKERIFPDVDESTRLLIGEVSDQSGGGRGLASSDSEGCNRNWGYLVIAAVFVMAFYAISNRDK